MNRRSTFLAGLLLAVLALAVLVAACGGGGGSSGDETQIEETITGSVTSTDPSKCTELVSQKFLEQTSDQTGKAVVEECEREASDTSNDPEKVEVSAIKVEGADATAAVAFVGGGFNGQTLDVVLVKDGGQWKLDEITGFAKLDSGALATTFEEQFEKASSAITPKQLKCIGDKIRNADEATIEELVLSGSSTPLIEFVQSCE